MKTVKCVLLAMALATVMLLPAYANEVNLSPPWIEYGNQIKALFGEDPDVKIEFDDEAPAIKLYVTGQAKAEAIDELLPDEQEFGNVIMPVNVIPANEGERDKVDIIKAAFDGNPALSYIYSTYIMEVFPTTFVVFKNKVVQYFNDDLSDVNGNRSTLYQEIAKEVLGESAGIHYCTDVADNIGKPLGEWP